MEPPPRGGGGGAERRSKRQNGLAGVPGAKLHTQQTIGAITEGRRGQRTPVRRSRALCRQIATINHHPSADLRATGEVLQGAAGRRRAQFLSDSLRPPATEAEARASLSASPMITGGN